MKMLLALTVVALAFSVGRAAPADATFEMTSRNEVALEKDLEGIEDFLKCAAKCIGETALSIFKDCNFNMTCWKKELMGKVGGEAFICAVKCYDVTTRSAQLELMGDETTDPDANGFVLCMADCTKNAVFQIRQWYEECGRNIVCWAKKIGWTAVSCVGKCILTEQIELNDVTKVHDWCKRRGNLYRTVPGTHCRNFTQRDLKTHKTDMLECPANLMFNTVVCVCDYPNRTTCAKPLDNQQLSQLPAGAVEQSNAVSPVGEGNDFLKCLAKCAGKSLADIEKWYKECGKSKKCWIKKLGFRGMKCVGTCIVLEATDMETSAYDVGQILEKQVSLFDSEDSNNFFNCLAKCLGHSLPDVIQWYHECGSNVGCWLQKVGLDALKCVPKCISDIKSPATSDGIEYEADHVTSVTKETDDFILFEEGNGFVKCVAKCAGKSLADVEKWYQQCGKSKKCWLKKLGMRGVKCIGKCIIMEATEMETFESEIGQIMEKRVPSFTTEDNNRFVQCMASCLGKSLGEVQKWFEECGSNTGCWLKKVGFQGMTCVAKCVGVSESAVFFGSAGEHETSKVGAENDFLNCMGRCLGKSVGEIEKRFNECQFDAKCWMRKVGFQGLTCAGRCISMTDSSKLFGTLTQGDSSSDGYKFEATYVAHIEKV